MATTTEAVELGLRIDALRSTLGISVERLATESQIPSTTLERRLRGDGRLTVAELSRLSSALNVTPASWFEVAA